MRFPCTKPGQRVFFFNPIWSWVLAGNLGLLMGCSAGPPPSASPYLGYEPVQLEATGFFRVEQLEGRWFFVTPDGHPYLALGANHMGRFLDDTSQSAPFYGRFDDRQEAERALSESMRELGLTAGEAYAPHNDYLRRQWPYIPHLQYPAGMRWQFDIFDPRVQQVFYDTIYRQCLPYRQDERVIGIGLVDLPLWNFRRADDYRNLAAGAPGKKAYVRFLREHYRGDIASFNRAYRTDLPSFEAIGRLDSFRVDAQSYPVVSDDNAFLAQVADTLYRILHRAVRAGAPDHLFLGERFVLRLSPDPVLRVVSRYVDVFCTQALIFSPQRPPEWQVFQKPGWDHAYSVVEKPILVIDWATPFSLDSAYEVPQGHIKPQAEAAANIARWLEQAFAQPYIVGAFKCQLIGTHGVDRRFPAGRMKRTLLQDNGTRFRPMADIVARAHRKVLHDTYRQHLGADP